MILPIHFRFTIVIGSSYTQLLATVLKSLTLNFTQTYILNFKYCLGLFLDLHNLSPCFFSPATLSTLIDLTQLLHTNPTELLHPFMPWYMFFHLLEKLGLQFSTHLSLRHSYRHNSYMYLPNF